MAVDKEQHSAPADSEEQISRVPRWLVLTAVLALAGVAIVIVYGYLARPKPEWVGVANKNVWDWLDLLVVPAALAVGVYWLNTRQAARQQREEDRRQGREDAAQEAQLQQALASEDQRAQDAALQAYLDQMSYLLTDAARPLRRAQPSDDLSIVARARTLTVLPRLDEHRKARVVQFLYESGLIHRDRAVLDLSGADLSKAYLRIANLSEANLSHTNLSESDLRAADLHGADLSSANLSKAALYRANLSGTDLRGTDLKGANLSEADLSEAPLIKADLRGANLTFANLNDSDPTDALLDGAEGITNEELEQQAETLEGATMPNGQTYEEWLKDKEG